MKCFNPVGYVESYGSDEFRSHRRCGSCAGCLVQRQQEWATRMALEAQCHAKSVFVTLTYNDSFLPADGSVSRRELQLFLKRFRKAISPVLVRYFACGEYGDVSGRPHYHLVLFGVGVECLTKLQESWSTRVVMDGGQSTSYSLGFVSVSEFTLDRALYVAKYILKSSTWQSGRSDGRAGEFSLMSRRPGLGVGGIAKLSDEVCRVASLRYPGLSLEEMRKAMNNGKHGYLHIGGRLRPVGRLLRQKFRASLQSVISPKASAVLRSLDVQPFVSDSDAQAVHRAKSSVAKMMQKRGVI